jgi:tRNA1Val (adenine37-N6)-methyltransferase
MFHFKQFSIDDSQSAMKTGTDSVLLGAWVACSNETRILDIGTGSGILALMMAQRNPGVMIDAVEIEELAAGQAITNTFTSPWKNQVEVFHDSIQDFSLESTCQYSLIISNPPFFTASLKAPSKSRNLARHNDSLPVRDLLRITSGWLLPNGKAAFIIPADAEGNWLQEAAKQALFTVHLTAVKSTAKHPPHRVLVQFSKTISQAICKDELTIYNHDRTYSRQYRELTKDFYLKF